MLGERLKHARERKEWSQRELARQAGVRHAIISELETGKKTDTIGSILKRLARALGVSVDYLIGTWDDEDEEPALATVEAQEGYRTIREQPVERLARYPTLAPLLRRARRHFHTDSLRGMEHSWGFCYSSEM